MGATDANVVRIAAGNVPPCAKCYNYLLQRERASCTTCGHGRGLGAIVKQRAIIYHVKMQRHVQIGAVALKEKEEGRGRVEIREVEEERGGREGRGQF
jgi:hypothetical protein